MDSKVTRDALIRAVAAEFKHDPDCTIILAVGRDDVGLWWAATDVSKEAWDNVPLAMLGQMIATDLTRAINNARKRLE